MNRKTPIRIGTKYANHHFYTKIAGMKGFYYQSQDSSIGTLAIIEIKEGPEDVIGLWSVHQEDCLPWEDTNHGYAKMFLSKEE